MKKIKGGQITFIFNDDGSLAGIAGGAEKAAKSTKKLNKNVQTADRRLKGASQQSSNTTKNFSKMQQGIQGGLVPAYATLAASLFALGAVFRALQDAADFSALTLSQQVFARETGVALSSVSLQLQRATQNQIDLQKAGQSAAIMIAKGFTPDQIEQVANASVNAAIALGRNFEDTFNRIVQGTTKAEPELLDELGITLRLEKATRDFAQAVGKNREELTAFERSQAVLNETLRQAEENFGAIDGAVPINKFNQLGTLFSDLAKKAGLFIQPLANFLGSVLVGNVTAAAAAMGLFATSILSAVIPGIEEMGAQMDSFVSRHDKGVKQAQKQIRKYKEEQDKLRQSIEQTRAAGAKGVAGIAGKIAGDSPVLQRAAEGQLRGADKANLAKALASAESQYQKHGKIVTGIFKGKDIAIVRSLTQSYVQMNTATQTWSQKTSAVIKRVELSFKAAGARIRQGWSLMLSGMTQVGKGFVGGMNKILSAAGFIGILFLVIETIKNIIYNIDNLMKSTMNAVASAMDFIADSIKDVPLIGGGADGLKESAANLRAFSNDFKLGFVENLRDARDKAERFKISLENINTTLKDLKAQDVSNLPGGALARAQFIGNRVTSSNILGLVTRAQSAAKRYGADDQDVVAQTSAVQNILNELSKTTPEFATFGNVLDIDIDKLSAFILKIQSGGQALKSLGEEQETVNRRRAEFAKQMRGGFFDKELASVRLALNAVANVEGELSKKDKSVLENILGFSFEGNSVEEFRQAVAGPDGIIANLQNLIDQQRNLQSKKLGLDAELAGLEGRKGALARFERERIKKEQFMLKEDEQRQKIAEFEYNMQSLKGTELENAEANLKIMYEQLGVLEAQTSAYADSTTMAFKLQNTFEEGIEKMFFDIATGAANAADAFRSMAKTILIEMAKIAAARMAANLTSFIGLADGGVIPMASGGIINRANSYAAGGIATEPTYLVGEGKYNEAVVPLPNGRSIPVDMKGTSGTNVTINIDGSSTASGGLDANAGKQLGHMIQAATMEIIQREKRPGGVLSR